MSRKERAVNIARDWYAGGNAAEAEDDLQRTAGLAHVIEKALNDMIGDCAEVVSALCHESGTYEKMVDGEEAHKRISMLNR